MKIEIENCKCPSWNKEQISYFRDRGDDRDCLKSLVWGTVKTSRTLIIAAEALNYPVRITFEAHFKGDNRRDPDNLFVKPLTDGLVAAKVLPDDSSKYVESVTLKAKTKMPSDKIIIFINE